MQLELNGAAVAESNFGSAALFSHTRRNRIR